MEKGDGVMKRFSDRKLALGLLLLLAFASSGCAGTIGSRGSWGLWQQGSRLDGFRGLAQTGAHLEGFNSFSDVGMTWKLLAETGREGGFLVALDDLFSKFIGPYSFEGMGSTFRHLRQ